MKYTSTPPLFEEAKFHQVSWVSSSKSIKTPDPVDSWVSCFTKAYPSTILFPDVEGKMTIQSLD